MKYYEVRYFDNLVRSYTYAYDGDDTIEQGDFVVVPVGINNDLTVAKVVSQLNQEPQFQCKFILAKIKLK